MAEKYYAVKAGHKTGIFRSWPDCQAATAGYSGADYKFFNTEEEAEAYLRGVDIYLQKIKQEVTPDTPIAYCDGGYDEQKKRYAYGVVVIDHKLQEYQVCASGKINPKYVSSNNIVGEVFGALSAMDWAISNSYSKIKIYHDYEGIRAWISGEWQAKSDIAKDYQTIYTKKFAGVLDVTFCKVEGHSNNKYNELADSLAKNALFDGKRVSIKGDNWYTISSCGEDDIVPVIDLMERDFKGAITCDRNDNDPHKVIYKLKYLSDTLTVSIYTTKTLLVQGRHSYLFQVFLTYLNELLAIEPDSILANAYRKYIDKNEITKDVNSLCPIVPSDWPPSLQKLIRQSVINLKHYAEAEDYTQYAFPALKALEGYIRYILKQNGYISLTKDGFNCFQKDTHSEGYLLAIPISNTATKNKIEACYNYYKKWRHSLFHFGDIIGDTDSTKTLKAKGEADEIIKECLHLICI